MIDIADVRLTILRAGDVIPEVAPHSGEFHEWIARAVAPVFSGEILVHDLRGPGPLPGPRDADAFVVTGSSNSVTERAPWMLRAEGLVGRIAATETPLFGICFGQQLIGQALGGKVAKNPKGRELGTLDVRLLPGVPRDPIFDGVSDVFAANHAHVDSVVRVPDGAVVVASSEREPCSAFVVGRSIKCVQFHPEIDAATMRRYVRARADRLRAEGVDPELLYERASDAPMGARVLQNFVADVVRGR